MEQTSGKLNEKSEAISAADGELAQPGRLGLQERGEKPPVIAYATPVHLQAEKFARRGNGVIIPRKNAVCPEFCFKCGQPAHETMKLWVYTTYGVINLQRVQVALPMCPRHMMIGFWIKNSQWICVLMTAALLVVSASIYKYYSTIGNILGLASLLFLFASFFAERLVRFIAKAQNIDKFYSAITGAGKEFLEKLPEI